MTFYEAALHVLEREGKPLHFKAITEKAVTEKLLSHVGKDPEVVMYSRLAAMARRKGDRKVVATEPGTFGLLDWGVIEDPAALDAQVIPVPDETEPPLRPRERHPIPSKENLRVSGRGERERPRKHREEERRKGKPSTLPELAFEVLSQGAGPMPAVDVAAALRDSEKVSEDLGAEALLNALREDNRRRQEAGRKPLFLLSDTGEIGIDRAGQPKEGVPVELEAAFAQALGVPLEGGPAREERREARAEPARLGPGAQRLVQQAREHQKNIGRVLRRRFGELEPGALELASVALLEAHGFREVRAAKRGKDAVVITARRREGVLDVRYGIKVLKGPREISKQDVIDLRKDLTTYNAHVAMIMGAGEVSRDARSEVLIGAPLLLLWASEALAEKLVEKKVGASAITIEVPDVDESFFRRVKEQGDLDDKRREERRVEREAREEREKAERAAREAAAAAAAPAPAPAEGGAPTAEAAPASTEAAPAEAAPAAAPAEAPAPAPAEAAVATEVQVIQVRVDLGAQPPPADAAESIAAALAKQEEQEAAARAAEAKPEEKKEG